MIYKQTKCSLEKKKFDFYIFIYTQYKMVPSTHYVFFSLSLYIITIRIS